MTDMEKLKDYIVKYFMNNNDNINPVSEISTVSLNDFDTDSDEIFSRKNNSVDKEELFYKN